MNKSNYSIVHGNFHQNYKNFMIKNHITYKNIDQQCIFDHIGLTEYSNGTLCIFFGVNSDKFQNVLVEISKKLNIDYDSQYNQLGFVFEQSNQIHEIFNVLCGYELVYPVSIMSNMCKHVNANVELGLFGWLNKYPIEPMREIIMNDKKKDTDTMTLESLTELILHN